jgi:predicted metallopeptidase
MQEFPDLSYISEFDIRIGYVRNFDRKCKGEQLIFGRCVKVPITYQAFLPFDFIIELFEPNIELLTDEQLKILIYHELLHIDIGPKGPKVKPHDIEDFYTIIDRFSSRWNDFQGGE